MGDHDAATAAIANRRMVGRTILVIDLVDSVPLIRRDEADTLRRWESFVAEVRTQVLPQFGLDLVKSMGDGLRLLAPNTPLAVAAAKEMNRRLDAYNVARDADSLLKLHAAIHVADVVETDIDIHGHGVNVAARLASQSAAGEILLSDTANEQMLPILDAVTVDLGDFWLKGLDQPVRAYRVLEDIPPGATWPESADGSSALRAAIAIMPFDSGSDVGATAWLGELLADELICALGALPEVAVLTRLSTRALGQRGMSAEQAAPALQADYVLSGSCRCVGEQVIVHAELLDARRSEVVQHMRETAPLASLTSIDSPLINGLLGQIGQALMARQATLARRSALPNLADYTLLLGGVTLMHRLSRRDFERAGQLIHHLAERWPRLPTPHAWLGRWHLFRVLQRWSADVASDTRAAHDASRRALDLDAESSVALAVAGSVRIGLDKDVDAGLSLYDQALRANPSDSLAWMLRGTAKAFKGEGPDAVQASACASRLSPLDPLHFMYDCHAAGTALAAEDPRKALDLAERSMRANAMHLSTYRVLALSQMLTGNVAAARDTVSRLCALDPQASVDQYLRTSPSAAYPIGQRFAGLLAQAGLRTHSP